MSREEIYTGAKVMVTQPPVQGTVASQPFLHNGKLCVLIDTMQGPIPLEWLTSADDGAAHSI